MVPQQAQAQATSGQRFEPPVDLDVMWQRALTVTAALPNATAPAPRFFRSAGRGVHGRRRPGSGDIFWQFRPFQQGDAGSDIDWRRSARSDALYVRQNEWESAQTVWFWIDLSPSMDFSFRKKGERKIERALVLALAVARQLIEGGERIGLIGMQSRALSGKFGLTRFRAALTKALTSGGPALDPALPITRHSHILVISDFLGNPESFRQTAVSLSARDCHGHLLQILDPAEEDFPYRGRTVMEAPWMGERHMLERAEDVRGSYCQLVSALQTFLTELTSHLGWTVSLHRTDRPAHAALLTILTALDLGRLRHSR